MGITPIDERKRGEMSGEKFESGKYSRKNNNKKRGREGAHS